MQNRDSHQPSALFAVDQGSAPFTTGYPYTATQGYAAIPSHYATPERVREQQPSSNIDTWRQPELSVGRPQQHPVNGSSGRRHQYPIPHLPNWKDLVQRTTATPYDQRWGPPSRRSNCPQVPCQQHLVPRLVSQGPCQQPSLVDQQPPVVPAIRRSNRRGLAAIPVVCQPVPVVRQAPVINGTQQKQVPFPLSSGMIPGGGSFIRHLLVPRQSSSVSNGFSYIPQDPPRRPSQSSTWGKSSQGHNENSQPTLEIGGAHSINMCTLATKLDLQVSTIFIPGDLMIIRGTSIILNSSTTLGEFYELLHTHKWYAPEAGVEHGIILEFLKDASREFTKLYHEFECFYKGTVEKYPLKLSD